jgi:hypothetical protein
VIHLANPHSVTLERLLTAIRTRGRAVDEVPAEAWRSAALEAITDPDVAATVLALCRCFPGDFAAHRPMDLFAATDVSFGLERVTADLAGLGLVCPQIDDTELGRLVDFSLRGVEA